MAKQQAKVVVITGGSAGVGRAAARAFAQGGAAVAVLARSPDGLQGAVRDIERAGGRALAIATDVAETQQVEDAAEQVEGTLGPIDVWVNDAMVTVFSRVTEMSDDEYLRVTQVNYLGAVRGTQAALKRMIPRNRGVIVQVGSALAYRGLPLQSAYCGAKFALRGFTDALRGELLYDNHKIHLTMVHLAAFNTPQFEWARHRLASQPQPLPPIFQPEVAARAIVWAAHHRRREVYVGFPALKIILGNKLVPGLIDRMASKKAIGGQIDKGTRPTGHDNLFHWVPGDFGARGRFDAQARDHSWQLRFTLHRVPILVAVAVILILLAVLLW